MSRCNEAVIRHGSTVGGDIGGGNININSNGNVAATSNNNNNNNNNNNKNNKTVRLSKNKQKRRGFVKNFNNLLFLVLVGFMTFWITVHQYVLPKLTENINKNGNGNSNNNNSNNNNKRYSPLLKYLRNKQQQQQHVDGKLNDRHHQFLDHNHEEIVPQSLERRARHQQLPPKADHHAFLDHENNDDYDTKNRQHRHQQLPPKEAVEEGLNKSINNNIINNNNNNNNPYEGWQPKIYVDPKKKDSDGHKCNTWRTCFLNEHGCPGKCRDGLQDWGTPPSPPENQYKNEQWVPDVTVLRRMMINGKDSDGNPWPPPLVSSETDKELCEKIGFSGGYADENIVGINAANIRGMPLVLPKEENNKKLFQPRILCMVYTMEQNHHTSIRAIRETWGGGCDGFLAFSTKDDPRIPAISIQHEGPEEYNNMWQKVRSIWRFVGEHYLTDFDYFFQGGEDLYVLPQNLRNFLSTAVDDPTKDDFFGGRRFQQTKKIFFNSGGAGYAMSQATLRKFYEVGLDHKDCFSHSFTAMEDVMIARCLKDVFDIGIVDTRDSQERERFHPFSPGSHYYWTPPEPPKRDWYEDYNRLWPPKLKEQCCAPDSVSFHYMKKPSMVRHIHSLLYFCDTYSATTTSTK